MHNQYFFDIVVLLPLNRQFSCTISALSLFDVTNDISRLSRFAVFSLLSGLLAILTTPFFQTFRSFPPRTFEISEYCLYQIIRSEQTQTMMNTKKFSSCFFSNLSLLDLMLRIYIDKADGEHI